VPVRITNINDVDLRQFSFDFDLTMAILLTHADGTVFHRYGGRSYVSPMKMDTLLWLLEEGVKSYAEYRESPSAPAAQAPLIVSQLVESKLKGKMEPMYGCYHCHHVREAEQSLAIANDTWTPDQYWIWPRPARLGLLMDQARQNQVTKVAPESAAALAGIEPGDTLLRLSGKRMLTKYDIQAVLEESPGTALRLDFVVSREGKERAGVLELEDAWKVGNPQDNAWRVNNVFTHHMQKYLPTPGLVGEPLEPNELVLHRLENGAFGLKVTRLNYGTHLAGLRLGDVVVSANGKTEFETVREFYHWCETQRREGQDLEIGLLRSDKRMRVMVGLNYLNFPSVEKSPEILLGFTPQEVGWDTGLRVGHVMGGSSAELTGLRHGDRLLLVDGKKVLRYKALEALLNLKLPGDFLTLKIGRNEEVYDFAYVLADKEKETSNLAYLSAEVSEKGQELTCVVSMNLAPGDHIYSMHKKGFGLPTHVEFRGAGYELLGGVEEPVPVKVEEGGSEAMWVLRGSILFKQQIRITDPDKFHLALWVYAQVCDDQRCSELRAVVDADGSGVSFSEYDGDFESLDSVKRGD
jgi:S1-C subfamily serine protease